MPRIKRLLPLYGLLSLAACGRLGLSPEAPAFPEAPPPAPLAAGVEPPRADKACGGVFSQEQRMYLDLVQKMVEQRQYYAALAHLAQLEKTAAAAPQSVYLRAEALRGTDRRDEAEKLYSTLLNGCMVGYGLHGLGLLAVQSGQMGQAEDFLTRAIRERPVDGAIHNDLGMVLLLGGRREAARREFQTAMELDRNSPLPLENLIVLMLADTQRAEAKRLARERGLSDSDMARLSERARRLPRRAAGKQ